MILLQAVAQEPSPPPSIMRSLHLYHMPERGGEHSINSLAAVSDGMSDHLGRCPEKSPLTHHSLYSIFVNHWFLWLLAFV